MFKIPIIPPDLLHEETIVQAAYALDCLQSTITTIFEHIDKRIEENNVKVGKLLERIKKSQAKINSLHGTRNAIRIYAPSRFPSSTVLKDVPVTFDEDTKLVLTPVEKHQIKNKMDSNLPSLNEKLMFFHVRDHNCDKLTQDSELARERINIDHSQGLGSMPSDLRSIPSVLLFNTDYSVYNLDGQQTLGHSDGWKRTKLKNRQQHEHHQSAASSIQNLEPAPHSLVHRRNEKLTPSGGLKYTPRLTAAPQLDLPFDLPDLPGIAGDLRYESKEAEQKIAPSLVLAAENLPELAELMEDYDKHAPNTIEIDNSKPIPPPPPVKQPTVPPPPPLPPALEPYATKITNTTNRSNTVSTTSADTRSELMSAIRNAGGIGKARLRPTATAPIARNGDVVDNIPLRNPSTKNVTSSGSSQSGDLMADLHNKLLMRRKGISGSNGNKDNNNSDIKNVDNVVPSNAPSGNPVMSRLSSLIPPPPPVTKRATARTTATTSDEDDENDSNDADWFD